MDIFQIPQGTGSGFVWDDAGHVVTNFHVIEGGQNVQSYDLAPFEYEDNQHFFLGYAFHNWWDAGHRVPSLVTLHPQYRELIGIEV